MTISHRTAVWINVFLVICIIFMLRLIVINGMRRAEIDKMKMLSDAIVDYHNEYWTWPQDNNHEHPMDKEFYDTMAGGNPAGRNPRKIVFMARPAGAGEYPRGRTYTYQCDYDKDDQVAEYTNCYLVIRSKRAHANGFSENFCLLNR
jgi:hypothetical protein